MSCATSPYDQTWAELRAGRAENIRPVVVRGRRERRYGAAAGAEAPLWSNLEHFLCELAEQGPNRDRTGTEPGPNRDRTGTEPRFAGAEPCRA